MALMDRYLPKYQFDEHHSTLARATPGALLDAIKTVAAEPDPLVSIFIALRELPARCLGFFRKKALLPSRPFGLGSFTELGRDENHELAFGLAGRFWQMSYGLRRITNAAEFEALRDTPKLVMSFVAEPLGNGEARLSTTTRVCCPDVASLRSFTPYWYVIRPVSGLIRLRILRRIKMHAQAAKI